MHVFSTALQERAAVRHTVAWLMLSTSHALGASSPHCVLCKKSCPKGAAPGSTHPGLSLRVQQGDGCPTCRHTCAPRWRCCLNTHRRRCTPPCVRVPAQRRVVPRWQW